MSNKSTGTAFEKEFAELLASIGFWVHRLQDNQNGQPFDMIAAKNRNAYVIDCKDCRCDDFSLYRIEENQMNAMRHWRNCGNGDGLFAIKFSNGKIRLLNFSTAELLIETGKRRLRGSLIKEYTMSLEKWRYEDHNRQ